MANRQKFAFAQRGMAVTLAVTLVSSMSPALAFAQNDNAGGSSAVEAQAQGQTADNQMVDGKDYTVDIVWGGTMMAQYFNSQAQVSHENGSYTVKLAITDSENNGLIGDITYNGATFHQEDGVYTITGVENLKETLTLSVYVTPMHSSPTATFTIDYTQLPNNGDVVDPTPGGDVDTSALASLITSASAIEQGNKTDAAWDALQTAIGQAVTVLGDNPATQDEVDAAVSALQTAIDAFNESGDAVNGDLEVGKTYSLPVSFSQADGTPSMAGNMISKNAIVVPQEDGSYQVTLVVNSGAPAGYYFKALTFDGVPASKAYDEAGNYVFTGTVSSLDDTIEVGFTYYVYAMGLGMTHSAFATIDAASASEGEAIKTATDVNKADLNAAISAAKAVEQGKKTDDAWNALQDAISTADQAAANDGASQADVDAVLETLTSAITTFKTSPDASDPIPNDYGMEVGKIYTASVSYAGTGAFAGMNDILQQMVGKYFGNVVNVSLLDDGTYDVVVYFGGTSGYDDAIGDITYGGQTIKQSADQTYTINVPSLDQAIDLGLYVGGSMGMDVTYAMTVDTSTIAEKPDGPNGPTVVDKSALQSLVDQASAIEQGTKSDAAWESFQSTLAAARTVLNDANASQDAVNGATTSLQAAIDRFNSSVDVMFQVGHTYEVPMALFKHNSLTEKSMADKYFGDKALVRPQEDGTFKVSFAATSEGLGYISWLKHDGTQLSQNGSQFTMSIPASESDVVIPIEMAVTVMQQLGVGQSQTADMHLYLSQAKDLGTGQDELAASSSSSLARTGDSTTGLATLAIGVAAAGAAAAVASRRRLSQHK